MTAGLIFTTLAITACADDDDDAGEAAEAQLEAAPATEAPAALGQVATDESDTLTGSADVPSIELGAIGSDVIVEMHVVMSSDDIARSVASITTEAASLGGGIASSDVDYGARTDDGSGTGGHAILVVKVPPERVEGLLDALDDTGAVQSINQSAQDVTDQLVDLDVRIANARTSVANVREFMDSTTNLSELVTLEAELTRRQTELEQLEAQQRNLSDRVALATVTIEIVPSADVPSPADETDDGIGDAFRSGWDAFVTVMFGLVYVLAVLAPFLVIGLVTAAAVWLVVKRRTRGARTTAGPPTPDEAETVTEDAEREHASPVG